MSPSQHASFWTRQSATAFNQPLSFDTSSVTDMAYMFQVRRRACPCHPLASHVLPAGCLHHRRPHALLSPGPPCSMLPSWYASLWTRQYATAFNQPLSLDTSKVTSMYRIFYVRLRACPTLHLDGPHTLSCALHASRHPAPQLACHPLPMPPFRLGSRRIRSTSR